MLFSLRACEVGRGGSADAAPLLTRRGFELFAWVRLLTRRGFELPAWGSAADVLKEGVLRKPPLAGNFGSVKCRRLVLEPHRLRWYDAEAPPDAPARGTLKVS